MTVLDVTEFDFSQEHALGEEKVARRVATVRNLDAHAVLHVGVKSPVAWLEVYPTEFALAPDSAQPLTVELRPDRARNAALSPVSVSVFGQYLAIQAVDADALPADLSAEIRVLPPIADCPDCGADLPEGARECRRCGARIRLCPICGTPNNWLARTCRLSSRHVIRPAADWRESPGGNSAHALLSPAPLGFHLARRWSFPAFPPARAAETLEWSAPLAAFGMVIVSAIETSAGKATVQAWELASGATLWDFDLPDAKGLYPDRGAMALSDDGTLYAATLGGHVVALDAIRGTRLWETELNSVVYGGVTVAGDSLLVPAGPNLCALDRATGALRQTMAAGGRLDAAPAFSDGMAFVGSDDRRLYAFDVATGEERWRAEVDGEFDAAPVVHDGQVYAATMAGSVYALDAVDGTVRWRTQASAKGIAASPALSCDGLLYVPADDGFLHLIAADTGNLIRSRRVSKTPLRTAPVCSGETVFVGADDGILYAVDADYTVHRAYETTPGARLSTASPALYGDTLAVAATNGMLYVLQETGQN